MIGALVIGALVIEAVVIGAVVIGSTWAMLGTIFGQYDIVQPVMGLIVPENVEGEDLQPVLSPGKG